jgi:hypothetical protein
MPEPETAEISVAGVKLGSAPKWAAGTVALIGALVWAYLSIWQPQLAALTAEKARANAQAQLDEYGRLMAMAPEAVCGLLDDTRGKLTASRYPNNTILLVRSAPGMEPRSKVVLDLARDIDAPARPDLHGALLDLLGLVVEARGNCRPALTHECQPLAPDGRCFDTWYGVPDRNNRCMVPIWRKWRDGCTQWQWFDSCHSTFVGQPTWTNCAH